MQGIILLIILIAVVWGPRAAKRFIGFWIKLVLVVIVIVLGGAFLADLTDSHPANPQSKHAQAK
jgi:fumarate reductase subunit C